MNNDLELNIWNKILKKANNKQERAFLPSHHVIEVFWNNMSET